MSNYDNGYLAAQRAYDAQLPPDYDERELCEEGQHKWRAKKQSVDGDITLYKCRVCGVEEVD